MRKSYDFYKWSIWSILTLSFVTVFFHRMGLSVVADTISKELNLSAAQLGNLASVTMYSYGLMQIPVGILLDFAGPRKICFTGMLVTGSGSIIFALSSSLYVMFIGRFLVGLGTSVICISILKIQAQWFRPHEFSSASGKMSFVGNLGAVFSTFPLAVLVAAVGWRNSFHLMGFISLAFALLIYMFVRNRPSEYGFEEIQSSQSETIKIGRALSSVFKNKATWPNFFIMFSLVSITTTITGLWGIPYMSSVYGLTNQKAAFYISFITYGFICGSLLIGAAARVFGNNHSRLLFFASSTMLLIWIYIVIACGGKPSLAVMPVLFFLMGILIMSHLVTFTNAKEVNDIRYAAIAMSLINVGEFVGTSILSQFIGFVLDLRWTGKMVQGTRVYGIHEYKIAFYIFILMSLISVFASIKIRNTGCKTVQ